MPLRNKHIYSISCRIRVFQNIKNKIHINYPFNRFIYSNNHLLAENNNKIKEHNDIFNWMQDSTGISIMNTKFDTKQQLPSKVQVPVIENQINSHNSGSNLRMIPSKEFEKQWLKQFQKGDLRDVQIVLRMFNDAKLVFSLHQLSFLVKSLNFHLHYQEIHKLFVGYQKIMSTLIENISELKEDEQLLVSELFETFLKTEEMFRNYDYCEEIFSYYIQASHIKPRMILIGLKSFIRNNNIQLAIQVYIQALENPDIFPMDKKVLYTFLVYLHKYSNFSTVKYVFNLWIEKKCSKDAPTQYLNTPIISDEYLPDNTILSLMHKIYLHDNSNHEELQKFLEKPINSNYLKSPLYEMNCLIKEAKSLKSNKRDAINDQLFTLLKKGQELSVIENNTMIHDILVFCVGQKDFSKAINAITFVENERKGQIDYKYCSIISSCFLQCGFFDLFFEYYKQLRAKDTSNYLHINENIISQYWTALVEAYPYLFNEIRNDFGILISKDEYKKIYPWLSHFSTSILKQSKSSKRNQKNKKDYWISTNMYIDFERLKTIKSLLKENKEEEIKQYLTKELKQGTCPHFSFFYHLLDIFLTQQKKDLVKFLENTITHHTFYYIPLKYEILKLRHEIEHLKNLNIQVQLENTNEELMFGQNYPKSVIHSQLRDRVGNKLKKFYNKNKTEFNFQNYIQFSQIAIEGYRFDFAYSALENSENAINKNDRKQLHVFYLTKLRLQARSHDHSGFCETLTEWNHNSSADLLTRKAIKEVKRSIWYFNKKKKTLGDIYNFDPLVMNERLNTEQDKFIERYGQLRKKGLLQINIHLKFLKKWLDDDLKTHMKLYQEKCQTSTKD